jgi:myo-inositol-1(or 4)-monophosphatase
MTSMPAMDVLSADWPGICRRIVAAQRGIFAATPSSAERTVYEGVGEGGDRTLAIDRRCEDAVFAELERLAEQGCSFVAVSEERGEVTFGDGGAARVVIDPIDGSLNARRTIPFHSLSIAVASGDSMADVEFGFVHDFGAGEEFAARRGAGATLGGESIRVPAELEKLEVVGVEAAEPEWALPALEALAHNAYRLRVVGSIAITAAYVAAGRFDAMISLRSCRLGPPLARAGARGPAGRGAGVTTS